MPLLIRVNGISDHKLFAKSQLAAVTMGLYEQLTEGVALPSGATFDAPTDASGKKIMNLKEELEENPALKGAVKRVSLDHFEDDRWNGLPFSPQQFLLEVEVDKYALIAQQVGGSWLVAQIAGGLGAGKSADIVQTIYTLLASQLVEQVRKNGINIFISSPSFASKHFSRLEIMSADMADALHAGEPSRSAIPLEDCGSHCEEDMTDLDEEFPGPPGGAHGLPGGKIPEGITMWKRTDAEHAKVTGFRLVMTITSVNENFALTKLPVLRDGVAKTLKEALNENLRSVKVMGHRLFDVTTNVQGCGWKPALASQPPFPHDEAGCGLPPNDK